MNRFVEIRKGQRWVESEYGQLLPRPVHLKRKAIITKVNPAVTLHGERKIEFQFDGQQGQHQSTYCLDENMFRWFYWFIFECTTL